MMMLMRDKNMDNIGGHYDDEHEGITAFASKTKAETTEEKKQKRLITTTSRRVAAGGGSSGIVTCQAEKCTADLTDSKRYHRRHKVCEVHAKAPSVLVSGLRQRFCQQCSRFHELPEFDDTKRSCRRRLAGHNERRRKISSESQAEGGRSNPQLRPCDQERAIKTTQQMSSFSFPSGNVMLNNLR